MCIGEGQQWHWISILTHAKLWLEAISEIVERLQRHFSDYARALNASDDELLGSSFDKTSLSVKAEPRVDQHTSKPASRMSAKAIDFKNAARWGLWGKKRLAEAVNRFREENKSLQQVLNLATASHVQQLAQPELALENLVKDEDASRLGLAVHAEIRQVLAKPESKNEDLCLEAKVEFHPDARVSNTSTECLLQYCRLSSPGSAQKRTVLVEYKSYPPGTESSDVLVDHSRQSRVHLRINQLAIYSSRQERVLWEL